MFRRIGFSAIVLGAMLVASSAEAGSIMISNGKTTWESTACTQPVPPAAIASLDPDSQAEDLNQRMTAYNAYAQQMQTYMDCVSDEAQQDANSASETITASAKSMIDQAQARLVQLNPAAHRQR